MKVFFAIPALTGEIKSQCHQSLMATYRLLNQSAIEYDEVVISDCPYLPVARSTLVAMFMKTDYTDLFFIDSDVGFGPEAVIKILERPEEIVAGIYPLKKDEVGYPVVLKTMDGIPIGRDGLIEAELLPTGFMRIKRCVFEKMEQAYPHLHYKENVVEVRDAGVTEGFDFFHMGVDNRNQRFTTEDYAFCQRWRDVGGQCWVYPDINFHHVGRKAYVGNLHTHLLTQPGGSLERALNIRGWLFPQEAEWLARQAQRHSIIVEIGSSWGRSTRAMADHMNGGVLYAIDDWHGAREATNMSQQDRQNLYEDFLFNLDDHIQAKRVLPIRCDHNDDARLGKDIPNPDMVFIDGDHHPESVLRDVAYWKARMNPGGLICGHDFDREAVALPVKQIIPDVKLVPQTTLWYWEVP